MSAIEPGSALLQLPRELKDQIYGDCLNKSYLVFWCYYSSPGDNGKRTMADLAILRTSKAISSDAKQFMFSKAASQATTFIFDVGFDSTRKFTTPPTKEATDGMMKVRFNVKFDAAGMQIRVKEQDDPEEPWPTFSMDSICEATVDRFAGTMVIRESFHIKLSYYGIDVCKDLGEFMRTPFIQTLKRFNGFRKVVVELRWAIYQEADEDVDTEKVARALQMEMEPSLGYSAMKRVLEPGFWVTNELEFYPLIFHAKNLRAEAARLTKEADMLEG